MRLGVAKGASEGIAFGAECLNLGIKRQATASALDACELVSFCVKDLSTLLTIDFVFL